MKSSNRMVLLIVASIHLALASSAFSICQAQVINRKPVKMLMNSQNPEFKSERIRTPMDLPDMPPYPGKNVQFVTGTIFPAVKGGPSITMEFAVKENPKEVLDWYKATFAQYQWKEQDNMTGGNGVAAMKSHNICQVMTLGPNRPGAKCNYLLRYKFYKATNFNVDLF